MIYSALTTGIFAVTIIGSYWLLSMMISSEYVMDDVVKNMRVSDKQPAQVVEYKKDQQGIAVPPRGISQIKENGVLRVGYNPNQLPFSYFNAREELVGFDVELIQSLGKELDIKIEFIPYVLKTAADALNSGQFDIAISGMQMTTERIQLVSFTTPVLNLHYALVLKDYRLDEFDSDELIEKAGKTSIAHVGSYPIVEHLSDKFPNLVFVSIQSDREYFDNQGKDYDALLTSLEAGKSWTLLYPEYTTLFRREGVAAFPAAYAIAQENVSLLNFMNNWLELQRTSGKIDQLFDYWIQGKNAIPKQPRWSIIKDVLHWQESKEKN